MRIKTFILIALSSLLLLPVSVSAKPHQALVCKSWVSGNGIAFLKVIAKAKARQNWKNKVTGLYGASWANFSLAKVGAFPCNKVGNKQSCTVRAKPCKKLGFGTKRK